MSHVSMNNTDLRNFSLFSDLSSDDCVLLAPLFKLQDFSVGSLLVKQDDISSNLFLVVSGIVEVRLPLIGPNGTTSVGKFGPGECVGELSLAKLARRAASATAHLECQCLVADTVKLNELLAANPKVGFLVFRKLAAIITERLVATNMKLRNSESHV